MKHLFVLTNKYTSSVLKSMSSSTIFFINKRISKSTRDKYKICIKLIYRQKYTSMGSTWFLYIYIETLVCYLVIISPYNQAFCLGRLSYFLSLEVLIDSTSNLVKVSRIIRLSMQEIWHTSVDKPSSRVYFCCLTAQPTLSPRINLEKVGSSLSVLVPSNVISKL